MGTQDLIDYWYDEKCPRWDEYLPQEPLKYMDQLAQRDKTRSVNDYLAQLDSDIKDEVLRMRAGMSIALQAAQSIPQTPEHWWYRELRKPGIHFDSLTTGIGRLGIARNIVKPCFYPMLHPHLKTRNIKVDAGGIVEASQIVPVACAMLQSRFGYKMSLECPYPQFFGRARSVLPEEELLGLNCISLSPELHIQQGQYYCLPAPVHHAVNKPYRIPVIPFSAQSLFVFDNFQYVSVDPNSHDGKEQSVQKLFDKTSQALRSFLHFLPAS